MGARGRKSAASLSVIGGQHVDVVHRPEPPSELTAEQSDVWRTVVNALPADWFGPETHHLLVQYCRHVIRARRVAQLLNAAEESEDFDVREYRDLLRSEDAQSRVMESLATKMRTTQQTTYDKSKKKGSNAVKPWE